MSEIKSCPSISLGDKELTPLDANTLKALEISVA